MGYRIFIAGAWCSACVHTLDLGLTSHAKDGVQSALVGAWSLIPYCDAGSPEPTPFGPLDLLELETS